MERIRTCVTLPKGLPERARAVGVNVSATAARAVLKEVKIAEKETGANAAKQSSPAVTSCGGT